MSDFSKDEIPSLLAENALQIALNYLSGSGEIDDDKETCEFLVASINFMMRHGQRNTLLLGNRAITAFQGYRATRTIEPSRVSGKPA
jgi:hypothetical protein